MRTYEPMEPSVAAAAAPPPPPDAPAKKTYGTGPDLTGNYASIQAAAQVAFERAKAITATQRTQLLQKYGYDPDGKLDSASKYGLYQQNEKAYTDAQAQYGVKFNADGTFKTDETNQDGILAQLARQRTQTQFNSGLSGIFDGTGQPTGLTVSGENKYGGYQQLLHREGLDLQAAKEDGLGRGLGTKGLGAQGVASLMFGQGAERQDFRSQVMDMLMQNASGQRNATKDVGDVFFNHGLQQNNLLGDMASNLGLLDQQDYQAEVDRNTSNSNGALQDLLERIRNGEFTPTSEADAVVTGGAGNGTSSSSSKGAQVSSPTAALAARSEALNKKYGLGAYAKKPVLGVPTQPRGVRDALANAYLTNPNKRG